MVLDTPSKAQVEQWFLDGLKCHHLMDEYKAGRPIKDIAGDRNVSIPELRKYFTRRYGDGWQRGDDKYKFRPRRMPDDLVGFVERIKSGECVADIAAELNTNPKALRQRLRYFGYSVREARG